VQHKIEKKKQMQNENNIKKKKRLMQQKNYLLQQQKNKTATTKGQMRDATSKNRVTKQRKLLVAIVKQHYCNNKNKKEMSDATSQKN